MISAVLYGLGLVLLIEGLVYVLAPHFVEKMLLSLKAVSYTHLTLPTKDSV